LKQKIKKFIKHNYYYILIVLFIYIFFFVKFPYYIDAPGGIINISDRVEISTDYESFGSFNLAYVSEYNATLYTLTLSLFMKDWNVIKQEDILLDNETVNDYSMRDKLLMDESISNAIFVAYTKANKDIEIINNSVFVSYIYDNEKNNLKIGDNIIEVNNISVSTKEEIASVLSDYSVGETIRLKVRNNGKIYNRKATLIDYNGETIIGVMIVNVSEYETSPKININTNKKESGPSGGLMLSLAIYNNLIKEDITHGKTIVGTGTIDKQGNVGSIGGVEYKLKSAVKEKADIFIVPNGENYDNAIELKEKNKYDIEIVGVSTFEDALEYLTK